MSTQVEKRLSYDYAKDGANVYANELSDYELAYSGISKKDASRCSVKEIYSIMNTNLKYKNKQPL